MPKPNTSNTNKETNRPKPMIPKTALKKNGNRYKCGGRLKK